METAKIRMEAVDLNDHTESLIAIGAAAATNCIPCFEHLYEKATTAGATLPEIKRAVDIAGQVKRGAHIAITNSINEVMGTGGSYEMPCAGGDKKSCCD